MRAPSFVGGTARRENDVDFASRPSGGSSADDAVTTWAYDARGNLTLLTDPDGVVGKYVYDGRNRLVEVHDAASGGGRLVYTLGSEGQRLKEEVFTGASTLVRAASFVYDKQGWQMASKDSLNRTNSYEYDASSRQTAIVDALGRRTTQTYDDLDRLKQTIADAAAGGLQVSTQFVYDAAGNLRRVTDPKGLHTDYTYDALGRLTQLQSPDTGITTYTYDSAGNRLTQTDARDVTATYGYDALGRLTGSTHAGISVATQSVSYAYDVSDAETGCTGSSYIGRLGTMTDPSGSTQYCYDAHGNTTSKAQTIGSGSSNTSTVSYGYSLGDRLASITYPGGVVIGYGRDAQGRIASMAQDAAPLVTATSYLPFGPLTGISFQGGASQTFTYDQDYAIDAISGTALNHDFTTDALGNITALPHATPSIARTFEYDALSRLRKVKDGSAVEKEVFAYDATGNRLSKAASGVTQVYSYPVDSHRLTGIDAVTRSYDEMGSLIDRGDGWTYSYDARQRLMEVRNGATLMMTNVYNGRGERVVKLVDGVGGGTSLRYLYDESGRLIAGQSRAGILPPQQHTQYVWLDDRPVALMRTAHTNETLHVHSDHLGTPRAVTRAASSNAVVWRWALTGPAFGEAATEENPDADSTSITLNYRFLGQYFDSESGLNYNYQRDYESGTGRYLESDPIGLRGGLTTYSYADSNSLARFDPTGLDSWGYLEFELNGHALVWGPEFGFSPLTNLGTGETCPAIYYCNRWGVGLQASVGVSAGTMLGAHCGKDLDGEQAIQFCAEGAVAIKGVSGCISTSPGISRVAGGWEGGFGGSVAGVNCYMLVATWACKNTPCECR